MKPAARVAIWAGACLALAGVFALYTRPDMMVEVGNMIWACFH